jgi:hypothetical protein
MSALTVDPRVIAEALQIDTYDLARVLVTWANDEMPQATYETSNQRGPMPLDVFDGRVERARYYLEAAHASFDAWQEDNPEDETE